MHHGSGVAKLARYAARIADLSESIAGVRVTQGVGLPSNRLLSVGVRRGGDFLLGLVELLVPLGVLRLYTETETRPSRALRGQENVLTVLSDGGFIHARTAA